jgi:hypothetical protein
VYEAHVPCLLGTVPVISQDAGHTTSTHQKRRSHKLVAAAPSPIFATTKCCSTVLLVVHYTKAHFHHPLCATVQVQSIGPRSSAI